MFAKEFDVIRLKDGRTATVLEAYGTGEAYLVEVCDSNGCTLDMPIVKLNDIEQVTWRA